MLKQKKAKRFWIDIDPYPVRLLVRIGGTSKQAERDFKSSIRFDGSLEHVSCACVVRPIRSTNLGMFFLDNVPAIEMIAHESLHVALFVFDTVGFHITAENAEPLTYLVENLIRTIRGKLRK